MISRTTLLTLLTLFAACAKQGESPRVSIPNPVGPTVAPPANVFLRNSFDTDPSRYVGRFVADSEVAIDESNSIPRACSRYVTSSVIEAGGTEREELFRSSSSAAASVGVPVVASGDASGAREAAILIKYTETKKVVSSIADPAGFATCCADSGNQCSGRYISEFIEGTGEIYYSLGTEAQLKASGGYQSLAASVEVKNGMVWQRATRFTNPVYFAFKVSPTGTAVPTGASTACPPDWSASVPKSDKGTYFVGVSDPIKSEREARDIALLQARKQAVEYLGQQLKSGTNIVTHVEGDVSALDALYASNGSLEAAANGISQYVAAERWSVCKEPGEDASYYKAYTLAMLPASAYTAAAQATVDTAQRLRPATP